jgi:hypothetical protein
MSSIAETIQEYLAKHGPVEDARGRATHVLYEAMGKPGNSATFTQTVSYLGTTGVLEREVKGRRTYKIAAKEAGAVELPARKRGRPRKLQSPEQAVEKMPHQGRMSAKERRSVAGLPEGADPRKVADALLEAVLERSNEASATWAKRRIATLESTVAELERDLAKARSSLRDERTAREEAEANLERARHNLELIGAIPEPKITRRNGIGKAHGRNGSRTQDSPQSLSPEEKLMLQNLKKRTPRLASERLN